MVNPSALTASHLVGLHEEGVPNVVLDYMQETYLAAVRRDQALEDWRHWAWAGDGYWYGGRPWLAPRVVVVFVMAGARSGRWQFSAAQVNPLSVLTINFGNRRKGASRVPLPAGQSHEVRGLRKFPLPAGRGLG